MAAPTIRGSVAPTIVTNGTVSITSPAATQFGDLCIFFLWTQGANSTTITHTLQSGFFDWYQDPHEDGTTDGRLSCCVKKAASGGAVSYSPYSVANGTASQSTLGMIALTAGTYPANADTVIPTLGTSTVSTGNQPPNPPSVSGLTGDYLVLAVAAWHVTTAGATAATAMTNYTIEIQNASASHVTHLAIARRALTGLSSASEDPAAFGDNVTPNGTIARTIAIRAPAAVDGGSIAADGAGAVVVSDSTRTVIAGVVAASGAAEVAVDGTVSGGGPATVVAGDLAVDGAGAASISGSTRSTLSSVDVAGAGSVSTTGTRTTFGVVTSSGAGAVTISGATRTTLAGTIAASGAGTITVVLGPSTVTAGSLTVDGVAGVAATGTRQTFGVLASSGGSSVAVSASTRTTFATIGLDGDGGISASIPGQGGEYINGNSWCVQDRNRRPHQARRRR